MQLVRMMFWLKGALPCAELRHHVQACPTGRGASLHTVCLFCIGPADQARPFFQTFSLKPCPTFPVKHDTSRRLAVLTNITYLASRYLTVVDKMRKPRPSGLCKVCDATL